MQKSRKNAHLNFTIGTNEFCDYKYESAAEAIRVNIQAEKDTIAAYQQLIERIRKNNPEKLTQSATVAIQLLNKIVSDERVHVRILSELAQSVAAEEGKEA